MVYNLRMIQNNDNSGRPSYDKIIGYIKKAKDAGDKILIGGSGMMLVLRLKAFVP
jgi:hypothetical protein